MEIQTNLDEILHKHPHLSKEGFGLGLTPAPSSPGPHELENLRKLQLNLEAETDFIFSNPGAI